VVASSGRIMDPEVAEGLDGTLYATWTNGDRDFSFATSTDGGDSWSPPEVLVPEDDPMRPSAKHNVAAGPKRSYVAWNDDGAVRLLPVETDKASALTGPGMWSATRKRARAARGIQVRVACRNRCRAVAGAKYIYRIKGKRKLGSMRLVPDRTLIPAGGRRTLSLRPARPKAARGLARLLRSRRAIAIARVGVLAMDADGNREKDAHRLRIVG